MRLLGRRSGLLYGASGFSLNQLPGLQLWLDPRRNVYSDAGTTLAVANDPVQQWNDQSGHVNAAVQATLGNRPLYKPTAINGFPGIQLDGADDYLQIADASGLSFGNGTTDNGFTIIFVFQIRNVAGAGNDMLISKRNDSLGTGCEWWIGEFSSGQTNFSLGDATVSNRIGRLDTAAIANSTPYIQSCVYDGSGLVGGLSIWRNGTRVDDTNDTAGTYVAMENSAAAVFLGCYINGASSVADPFEGDFGDIIILNRALSASERSKAERLLGQRYLVTVA